MTPSAGSVRASYRPADLCSWRELIISSPAAGWFFVIDFLWHGRSISLALISTQIAGALQIQLKRDTNPLRLLPSGFLLLVLPSTVAELMTTCRATHKCC